MIAQYVKKHWLGILAILILLFYLSSAFNFIDYPPKVYIVLGLSVGPVGMVGVLAITNILTDQTSQLTLSLAKVFGFIAFAIWEIVMCIQYGTKIYYQDYMSTSNQMPEHSIKFIYNSINSIQATMDIAFDIFYCLFIIITSYLMYHSKVYGKAVSIYGFISALALLFLNFWSFPYPPSESGLIDFGPFTAVWWIWVIVLLFSDSNANRSRH